MTNLKYVLNYIDVFIVYARECKMVDIKAFWEGEAEGYDAGIKEELATNLDVQWKKLIFDNSPQKPKLNILDIGTGPGFFPVILGQEGHNVTGIDVTNNMITWAKKNTEAYGVKATLLTMDTHHLDFKDNSFDVVLNRNVTWTLKNPEDAYKEWKRVLKPGGSLIIFDACWYLWMFDKKLEKIYMENAKRVKEKYGRNIHQHANQDEEDKMSKELYMSDKRRPGWDLMTLLELGFKEVKADRDITDLIWTEKNKDINWPTPQFMVCAKK